MRDALRRVLPSEPTETATRVSRNVCKWAEIAAAALLITGSPAYADQATSLQPHRAVYEITLNQSSVSAGIGSLSGRMVYELKGSDCTGYTQNMRMVTRTVAEDGGTSLSDLRSSFTEGVDSRTFRFETENFQDQRLTESNMGTARIEEVAAGAGEAAKRLKIRLSQPKARDIEFTGEVLFPVEHSVKLLNAAQRGERIFTANVYDGSDKGEKIYMTTAAIGAAVPADELKSLRPAKTEGAPLTGLKAWPVSLSYFEKEATGDDAAPVYELAFLFFENGVSRRLMIDYGTFAIRGTLTQLTLMEPSKCN